eukprot:Gb_38007 [translate_table: standard]
MAKKRQLRSPKELEKKEQQGERNSTWFEEMKGAGGKRKKEDSEWVDLKSTCTRRNVFVLASELRGETKGGDGRPGLTYGPIMRGSKRQYLLRMYTGEVVLALSGQLEEVLMELREDRQVSAREAATKHPQHYVAENQFVGIPEIPVEPLVQTMGPTLVLEPVDFAYGNHPPPANSSCSPHPLFNQPPP